MSKIAIRVDTNKTIATGHVMRCMAVAAQLVKMGTDVVVISADEGVRAFVNNPSISTHVLNTDWSDMESEIPALTGFLTTEGINCMLIDSYSVTPGYFDALHDAGIRVVYMDDLAGCAYNADVLINYNICAPGMGYEKLYGGKSQLFLGPKYAPLREQFSRNQNEAATASTVPVSILLTTGGTDSLGIAEKIIRAITGDGVSIHLLAGKYYEPTDFVLNEIDSGRVVLHQNVSDVAKVMSTCRIAISSAGSTLYELCAMGIPTVSFTFADNQIDNAKGFDHDGIIPYSGDFRDDEEGCIEIILEFIKETTTMTDEQLAVNAARMQAVSDGRGAERIARILVDCSPN